MSGYPLGEHALHRRRPESTAGRLVPGWNQGIFDLFERFRDPVVYTPGDNEWTDCHKKKEFSSGAPLNELAAVRGLFFANPATRSACKNAAC